MTDNPEVGLDSVSPGTADVAQAEPAAEVTAEAGAAPPALQPAAAQAAAAAAQPATPATVPPAASGTLPAGSQQAGSTQQSLRQLATVRWLDGDAAYLGLTAPEAAGLVPRSEPQLQPPGANRRACLAPCREPSMQQGVDSAQALPGGTHALGLCECACRQLWLLAPAERAPHAPRECTLPCPPLARFASTWKLGN